MTLRDVQLAADRFLLASGNGAPKSVPGPADPGRFDRSARLGAGVGRNLDSFVDSVSPGEVGSGRISAAALRTVEFVALGD